MKRNSEERKPGEEIRSEYIFHENVKYFSEREHYMARMNRMVRRALPASARALAAAAQSNYKDLANAQPIARYFRFIRFRYTVYPKNRLESISCECSASTTGISITAPQIYAVLRSAKVNLPNDGRTDDKKKRFSMKFSNRMLVTLECYMIDASLFAASLSHEQAQHACSGSGDLLSSTFWHTYLGYRIAHSM